MTCANVHNVSTGATTILAQQQFFVAGNKRLEVHLYSLSCGKFYL
jgi:hypothetical protein